MANKSVNSGDPVYGTLICGIVPPLQNDFEPLAVDTRPSTNSNSANTFVGGRRNDSQDGACSMEGPGSGTGTLRIQSASDSALKPGGLAKLTAENDEFPLGSQRYEDLQEIGRGGCGVVVRALDRQLQREVVVKRVLASSSNALEMEARFLNEARITGRLEHPGIVPVYEIGRHEQDGTPFYAMKWLQGPTLSQAISEAHNLQTGRDKSRELYALLGRFHQVCQALAYAHRMGVIHRDLKPANIVAGQFGETVVLDWGLAKQLGETESIPALSETTIAPVCERGQQFSGTTNSNTSGCLPRPISQLSSEGTLTQHGSILGTAAYMSPEQSRGESGNVDCRSDVFSLGVILYEIISGRSPFQSDSIATTLYRVARAQYTPIRSTHPNTPRALAAICERAMNLDSSRRYSDAGELAVDIQNFLAGESVSAYQEPWWGRIDRLAGKHRSLVWSSFIAMFVISMVAITFTAIIHQARQAEVMAKQQAQTEAYEKKLALEREQIAHQTAFDRLQAAREAVDAWMIDLSGDLQFYPGLGPLRSELFERAKTYYRSHADEESLSPDYTIENARANIRLGDISRLAGETQPAAQYYSTASKLLLPLVEAGQTSWSLPAGIQSANAAIGQAQCALGRADMEGQSQSYAEEAIHIAEQVRAASPESREARNAWIRACQTQARVSAKQTHFKDASAFLDKPIAMAELLAVDQGNLTDSRLLANLLADQASFRDSDGQNVAAIESYRRMIQFHTQSIRSSQPRPDWLESLAHARIKMSGCLIRELDPLAAIAELESAESNLDSAWELLYGEAFFRENIAICNANLGYALLIAGDFDRAEQSLRTAIEMMQWLVKREGSSNDRIHRMASCYVWLASVIQGRPGNEVNSLLRDGGVLIDHLLKQSEYLEQAHRLQVYRLWVLAQHQYCSGDLEAAKATCKLGSQLLATEATTTTSSEYSRRLQQGRLAAIRSKCFAAESDPIRAMAECQVAREHWSTVFESPQLQESALSGVSLIENLCEHASESIDDRIEALRIAEKLCEKCEKYPAAWHWLAVAAWQNHQFEIAAQASNKAKRLRTQATIEDQLLDAILLPEHDGSRQESVEQVLKQYRAKGQPNPHIEFLIRANAS